MSDRICSSCGTVSTGTTVYCPQCGGILENLTSGGEQPLPATIAVAKRRQVRIEADRPEPPTFFSRIKGLFFYLLWVAIGVIAVLSLMTPKDQQVPSQFVPNARDAVRKIIASSRYAPAAISQQLINSCLAQQGPVTWEAPVRLIPMPVWETSYVEITAGKVRLSTRMRFMGRPIHLSETFRLEGGAGAWTLTPDTASMGLLDLPGYFLPVIKQLLRPGLDPFAEDFNALSAARNLAVRPGFIEVSTR
jgi:hypothetical protein